MGITWLKSSKDNKSFRIIKNFGFDVYDIENLEETDKKLNELVNKNYNTIVITNEVASFSQDIIKKYNRSQNTNIIIAPTKKEKM